MIKYLMNLFVDPALLEINMSQQRLVIRTAMGMGLPVSCSLFLYELYIHKFAVAGFSAAFVLVLTVTLLVHVLPIKALKKYVLIKLISIGFIVMYGSIIVYIIAVEQDLSRLPWAFLLPVTAFYLLGTRMGVVLMTIFAVTFTGALLTLPEDVFATQNIEALIVRSVVLFPMISAVAFVGVSILKKQQKVLAERGAALRESEKRARDANEELVKEIGERKRYGKELEASVQEKEMLLRELNHRVKNNLQMVSSLLNLEAMKTDDPEVQHFTRNSQRRIQTMQMVHEMLYSKNEVGRLDFNEYVESIVSNLHLSLSTEDRDVAIRVDVPPVVVDVETAIPCGIIINEIVTNSMKHAFTGRASGEIAIGMTVEDTQCFLSIADNGIGMVRGKEDAADSASFGLVLVEGLVKQLGGEMSVESAGGTRYSFRFGGDSRFRILDRNN